MILSQIMGTILNLEMMIPKKMKWEEKENLGLCLTVIDAICSLGCGLFNDAGYTPDFET